MIGGEKKRETVYFAFLNKKGKKYEVIINPTEALDYRDGKIKDIHKAIKFEEIYSNAREGLIAANLKQVFNTNNILEVAKEILLNGEIKLTIEYKKKLQDKRRKRMIDIICNTGIDPRTNMPIPISRIDLAIKQVKFNFDPFKNFNDQLDELVEKIRPILPISFAKKELQVNMPAKYAGKTKGIIKSLGKLVKSNWENDGSFNFTISIPGGKINEVINKLNNISHGQANINIR